MNPPLPLLSSRLAVLGLIIALCGCDSPTPPPDDSQGTTPASLEVFAGNGQRGIAGRELPEGVAVRVLDSRGRPVGGAAVQFTVISGEGSVLPAQDPNDPVGVARVRWRLGPFADDDHVLEARVANSGARPVRLTARAIAGPVASVTRVAGNDGEGGVGNTLAASQTVRVTDVFGNGVSHVLVEWEAVTGGGEMSPAHSFTDSTGLAAARWRLGPRVDSAQTARAAVAGLAPVIFTARGTTSGATLQLTRVSGERQFGEAGVVLADSLRVVLRLPDGRPVRGAAVTWSAQAGAGSITPAVSRTDAQGNAAAVWRLGAPLGDVQATAAVDGWTVGFSAYARPGPPARLTPVAGDGATGMIGRQLDDTLAVRATDAYGYPAAGREVFWTVAPGGGSIFSFGTTDAQGIARANWVLGVRVDSAQTAYASAPGVTSATFHATAVLAGTPMNLSSSGSGQSGPVGSVLADSLVLVVEIPDGRRVQGALVTWAVQSGGGQVTRTQSRTSVQGRASTAWVLGPTVGDGYVTATVEDRTVTFHAYQAAGTSP
jgi:hypothetical protein